MNRKKERIKRLLTVQCSSCGACCRTPIATVTHYDIRRLMKGTGISAGRLVKLYANTDIACEDDDEDWIKLSYGKRMIGLRKKKMAMKRGKKTVTCMFLSPDRRCTVYSVRPMACRTHPLEITFDESDKIVGIRLEEVVRNKVVDCKVVYKKGKSRRQVELTALQGQNEAETYWKKLARWNKRSNELVRLGPFS